MKDIQSSNRIPGAASELSGSSKPNTPSVGPRMSWVGLRSRPRLISSSWTGVVFSSLNR